jgi:hypothetical protein
VISLRSSSEQAGGNQEDAKDQAHRGRGAHELPLSEALESLDISASLRHAVADVSHLVRDPPHVQHEENADRDGDPIDAHGAVLLSPALTTMLSALRRAAPIASPLAPSPGRRRLKRAGRFARHLGGERVVPARLAPRTQPSQQEDVEIGDTVLNVNSWWRVVALDNHGDQIDLWLGESSRSFRERKRPDDLVARASGQLTPPTSA